MTLYAGVIFYFIPLTTVQMSLRCGEVQIANLGLLQSPLTRHLLEPEGLWSLSSLSQLQGL
jgi:hypothetical protein